MNWQDLADWAAQVAGTDSRIVKATVEAETGGNNVMGDYDADSGYKRAFGYGQVWLKWHFDKLLQAADTLGVSLPSREAPQTAEDERQFVSTITGNDRLSMLLAALTIKDKWQGAAGNWDEFTSYYVGPQIPDADRERRRSIWAKYVGDDPGVAQGGGQGGQDWLKVSLGANSSLIVTGIAVGVLVALLSGDKKEG